MIHLSERNTGFQRLLEEITGLGTMKTARRQNSMDSDDLINNSGLVASPSLLASGTRTFPIPAQIKSAGGAATERFLEFFIATMRNPNTRKAYFQAVNRFFAWCDQVGIVDCIWPPISKASAKAMSAPRSSCISQRSGGCLIGWSPAAFYRSIRQPRSRAPPYRSGEARPMF